MRVLIPLADGVEPLEAVSIMDVLRRAGIEVVTVSLSEETTVYAAQQVVLMADQLWNDDLELETFAAIVLPGGGRGTERLAADERVMDALRFFEENELLIGAICAAPTVLVKAGVLDGCKATCFPDHAEALGASYVDVPVVADGLIITSQGPGTSLLFALVLVRHLIGEEVAERVADAMLVSL